MDLIIKVYNQYFRNVNSQRWKYVGYQYWYNLWNWCCTSAVHRYHFDCRPTVGFRQSEVGIQRWIDVGPIVNFCLGCIQKRSRCVGRFALLWSAINVFNWTQVEIYDQPSAGPVQIAVVPVLARNASLYWVCDTGDQYRFCTFKPLAH